VSLPWYFDLIAPNDSMIGYFLFRPCGKKRYNCLYVYWKSKQELVPEEF
jgi:hypothetical protein